MSLALASALRALALALALRAVASALVLALRVPVLGLGLGLEGPGLDYKHVNFILWDVSCQCVSPIFFKISFKHAVYCRPFSVLLSHYPSFSLAYGLYFISYVYLTLHKYVLLQCLGMGLHLFALFFLAFVDTVNLLTHFVAITVISYHVVMYLSHHLSSHFFM